MSKDLDPNLPVEPPKSQEMSIREAMKHHPFQDLMTDVFFELGGKQYILDWASQEGNQEKFLRMLTKYGMPNLAPVQGSSGPIQLHVHQTLGPSELDITPEKDD